MRKNHPINSAAVGSVQKHGMLLGASRLSGWVSRMAGAPKKDLGLVYGVREEGLRGVIGGKEALYPDFLKRDVEGRAE